MTFGRRSPVPPELGNLANLSWADLRRNALTGPIPPELGNSRDLIFLRLDRNDLTGTLPLELGNLVNLDRLDLGENNLTGPVPQSFLLLRRLRDFRVDGNRGLCVPGTSAFVAWLQGIKLDGVSCNAGDVAVLETLHELTGGTAWAESAGWLGGGAVEEWYGVTADSLGRVTALDLTRNGLAGRLPGSLAALARMTDLRIGDNAELSGRLPLSLVRLDLRELHYAGSDLCVPPEASFQTWLNAIPSHRGTGVECGPLSDREILEILYGATRGPNWTNNQNWLTDAPLRDWYGVRVDNQDRIVELRLRRNNLTGQIPHELGSLASLTRMRLHQNALTGAIPSELGNLASLTELNLSNNGLTGPIPSELGNLASLTELDLDENALTGRIPSEIGNLADLDWLDLSENTLSGPIPPEIGNLASVRILLLFDNALSGRIPPEIGSLASVSQLYLQNNELSGPIPPEIGDLSMYELRLEGNALTGSLPPEFGNLSVRIVHLDNNELEGPVPPEFGGISRLRRLGLSNNPGLAGALPTELTALDGLEALLAAGTDLCAPSDPEFVAWLERVHTRRIVPCRVGEPPMAYLSQAVQSREFPVPLVAGERALLRVFVTAAQATTEGIPDVRARFYRNNREMHVADIPGKSAPIPAGVDESSLSRSANTEISGHVIQPGLEMVIEVDPNGTLDPALGVQRRIPETGRLALDVRAMPPFDLTVIPFIWSERHNSSIVDLVDAMAVDPNNHELLSDMRTLLPVAELEVTAHEPVLTSTNNAWALRDETEAIRVLEGGTGYYMGMMPTPVTGASGVAFIPGKANFSIPRASTIAHELGHNLSLLHAPCGGAGGPDPSYPYSDGSIGAWGYDFRDGGSLVRPTRPDLMSYCGPEWVSDYSFSNTLRYRLVDEGSPTGTAVTAAEQALLLWGGITSDSVPFLNPAFVVEAPAALPDSAGEYAVTGRTAGANELFSLRFAIPETADGDGSSFFAFVLPVRPGWKENLASITISGPGGSFTLDGESDTPMAILRNPRTGQIRGILRDLATATQVAADVPGQAAGAGLEVLFSRGLPGGDAWRP